MAQRILSLILILTLLAPLGQIPAAARQILLAPQTPATDCSNVTEIPQAECEALLTFYNSTGGPNWTNQSGWGVTETPCSWFGVSCSNGRVSQISLENNNLNGTLPTALKDLSFLVNFEVPANYLTGSIPPELGQLPYLTTLNMYYNQFTGSIPPELGNATSLMNIGLTGNQLSGSIPSSFGNLVNLRTLHLYDNQFTGEIPASLGNLTFMQDFGLAGNQLTGGIPPELGNLVNVEIFHLHQNQLTGNLPTTFGNLAKVKSFSVSENQLDGTIPPQLGNLVTMEELYLYTNQFTGSIPAELGNLTNLIEMRLEANQLTGSIPASFGNLSSLVLLNLGENQLTGSIPVELTNLPNLGELFLNINQLSGPIPPGFGSMTGLWVLSLGENQLTGIIPPELGNLTNLLGLWLQGNQLTGTIPPQLGNLTQAWELGLSTNYLTGTIPAELGNLISLTELTLDNNQLTGSLPPELGSLANLGYLNVSYNQLNSTIPAEFGSLSNLNTLILRSCGLTGEIPPALGNLTNLVFLELGGNALTGTLPAELGNLVKLEALSVWGNHLEGTLPPELGNLTNLIALDVSANKFTGEVPASLTNLVNLYHFRDINPTWWFLTSFGHNMLTANDPATYAFLVAKDDNDWFTQTVRPTDLQVASAVGAVELSWTPITYTQDGGYYEIQYATQDSGPFLPHGITSSKSSNTYMAYGLSEGTPYYFRIRTFTPSHAGMFYDPYQKNDLWSSFTPIVTATPSYAPPQANFEVLPASGIVPLEVAFTNLSTGLYDTCQWSFGDNQTSQTCNPIHTFTSTGLFTVTLTVDGPGGASQLIQPELIAVGEQMVVEPDSGGTLVYTDPTGTATTITVPTDAVTSTIEIVFTPVAEAAPPQGLDFAGHAFTLDAYSDGSLLDEFTFNQPITLTLQYNNADVAGMDESNLTLFYWDELNSAWLDVAGTCSPPSSYDRHLEENWLSVPVCHLSQFGLFGSPFTLYLPVLTAP